MGTRPQLCSRHRLFFTLLNFNVEFNLRPDKVFKHVCQNQSERVPETETCLEPPNNVPKHFLLLCCLVAHLSGTSFAPLLTRTVSWCCLLYLFWKCKSIAWGCNYVPCLSGTDSQEPLHLQTGPWMDEKATWFLAWPLLKTGKIVMVLY